MQLKSTPAAQCSIKFIKYTETRKGPCIFCQRACINALTRGASLPLGSNRIEKRVYPN